jgi:hypothetical protein
MSRLTQLEDLRQEAHNPRRFKRYLVHKYYKIDK